MVSLQSGGGAVWAKDRLIEDIRNIKTVIDDMQAIPTLYLKKNQKMDTREVERLADTFVHTSKSFIAKLLLFESRVISNLPELMEKRVRPEMIEYENLMIMQNI